MKFKFKRQIIRNIQSKLETLELQRLSSDIDDIFKIELIIDKLKYDLELLS